MAIVSLSPIWNGTQFFDDNNLPLSGGKIFSYVSGSTTEELATYSDSTGNYANPNPITLDSSGRLPTAIWLIAGTKYNLVLTQPDGTTVIKSVDQVNTPRLLAGSNITLTPSTGVGLVTIDGSAGGSGGGPTGQSYLYWMEPIPSYYIPFDGSNFAQWVTNLKVPVTAPVAPDVEWLDYPQSFLFHKPGSYIVNITGYIMPLSATNWPEGNTVFGVYLDNNIPDLELVDRSVHTRYIEPNANNQPKDNQITTWTDQFTVSVGAEGQTLNVNMYAYNPDHYYETGTPKIAITITRIGAPYTLIPA